MTKFGAWIREWDWLETGQGYRKMRDLATLAAQLAEELDKRRNPGNPHLRESDHADGGGCPQDCLDFQAALDACKEFQETYGHE